MESMDPKLSNAVSHVTPRRLVTSESNFEVWRKIWKFWKKIDTTVGGEIKVENGQSLGALLTVRFFKNGQFTKPKKSEKMPESIHK